MQDPKLARRGILEPARSANWRPYTYAGRPGWAYDVYHYDTCEIVGTRWKAADGQKPKYLWLPSKPADLAALWYILPGTREAILAAGGTCYLANGEPGLLAYVAAGVCNVIATTGGESEVPSNVFDILQSMGITRLLYPVDNDHAGLKSAVKWRDALMNGVVDFEPLQWPAGTPEKGDANDVWILAQFDPELFCGLLDDLDSVVLPAPEIQVINDGAFDDTPSGLIDALAARLGVRGWKSNGWSKKNVPSPFRTDKNPSAGLNRESGVLHDFGTGQSYGPQQLAEQLGIDWKRFYPDTGKQSEKRKQSSHSLEQISAPELFDQPDAERLNRHAPLWWDGSMPDSWRTAILKYMPPTAAPLIEAVHEAARKGLIDPCCFTIQQVIEVSPVVGVDLPKSSATRMFNQIGAVFFSESDSLNNPKEEKRVSDFEINSRGRRSTCYKLRPLADVYRDLLAWARPRIIERHLPSEGDEALLTRFEAAMLESGDYDPERAAQASESLNLILAPVHARQRRQFERAMYRAKQTFLALKWSLTQMSSVVLPAATVKSSRDYRALYLRAQVESKPDAQRSARDIADMVGLQRQNIKSVKWRAGIKDEEQFVTVPLSSAADLRRKGYELKGFPQSVLVKRGERIKSYPYKTDDSLSLVSSALKEGCAVQARYQVANKQVIVRPEPLPAHLSVIAPAESPAPRQMCLDDLLPAAQDEKPPEALPVRSEPPETTSTPEQRKLYMRVLPGEEYFGPGFDSLWVYQQLRLALQLQPDSRYQVEPIHNIDPCSGEILGRKDRKTGALIPEIVGYRLIDTINNQVIRRNISGYDLIDLRTREVISTASAADLVAAVLGHDLAASENRYLQTHKDALTEAR